MSSLLLRLCLSSHEENVSSGVTLHFSRWITLTPFFTALKYHFEQDVAAVGRKRRVGVDSEVHSEGAHPLV